MSSGEGAEEAAKDAAEIAAFFKSGERPMSRDRAELRLGSASHSAAVRRHSVELLLLKSG